MKHITLFILFILSSLTFANSDSLVPLEVFAKQAKYTDMKISPTGKYLAFTYEEGTQIKLAILDRETNKPTASYEFGENRKVVQFTWLSDERISMTYQKIIGWLDGVKRRTHWAVANADGTNRRIIWDDRNLGNLNMIDKLDDEPNFVLATKMSWQDGGKVKLFKVNIQNSKKSYEPDGPAAAKHTDPGIVGYATDSNGKVRFAVEFDRGADEILPDDDKIYFHYKKLSNNKWTKLSIPSIRDDRPEFDFIGTSYDNSKVYFTSIHDQKEAATSGIFQFDLNTKSMSLIYRHPDVDVLAGVFGSKKQIIGYYLEPGYPEVRYIENDDNSADIKLHKSLSASFPGHFVGITSRTKDNKLMVLSVRSDQNPSDFYLFDGSKMKVTYIGSAKPEVKPKQMAKVEPFILSARDGLKMYGYLTIPNNVEQKNLPMVVYPHGGPYGAADNWRWDRRAQMLASRGYLVLQLNFRGSGGYGKDFEEAGHQEWGAKMQDDLTDATHWAINNGLADPNRICIHGVSYGGYAAMNAVVKEPDLYKCSIPDAGVYEMKVQWDEADSFRGYGGSKTKDWYMNLAIGGYDNNIERSPVYHVDKLKAALFLVHGKADVRVPIINAEILEEKLNKAGKDYIKLYKDEEGHGFTQTDNRVELYKAILKFLDENIGKK